MKAIDSIKRAIDYIEEHLKEDIKIGEVASNSYLSVFYFQRLFHETTGYSIEKYIKFRRLAHSTELLLKDIPMKEVAINSGFKSPEHFSRVFKETYKMTPSEYKKEKFPLFHVYKPDVILQNAKLSLGDRYIADNMVLEIKLCEKEEIKMIGLDIFCPFGIETPGIDNPGIAWNRFHKMKHTILDKTCPTQEFGISYNHGEKGFHYLASTAVNQIEDIPKDMISFILPKGLYACCIYENESFEDGTGQNLKSAMDYFFNWFNENNYRPANNYAIEYYHEEALKKPHKIEMWVNIKR
ncbi:AraC family transcriptional regulator [Mycoplasmatota bacterium]|nr:AraC family transcriptional regulator [Mycoplasmatota bacterium]